MRYAKKVARFLRKNQGVMTKTQMTASLRNSLPESADREHLLSHMEKEGVVSVQYDDETCLQGAPTTYYRLIDYDYGKDDEVTSTKTQSG